MKRGSAAAAVVALLLAGARMASAQDENLRLKWSELSGAAAGRTVTLTLPGNAWVKGTVESVQPDALLMNILKSSDKKAYASGQASIPRKAVTELRLKRVKGHARVIAAAGIGAAGSLISLNWALSESRITVSDSTRVAQWITVSAASTVGGYFLGRMADTHETRITVLPD